MRARQVPTCANAPLQSEHGWRCRWRGKEGCTVEKELEGGTSTAQSRTSADLRAVSRVGRADKDTRK